MNPAMMKKLAALRKELEDEYGTDEMEKMLRDVMRGAREDAKKRGNVAKEEQDDADVVLTVAGVQELIRDALEAHATQAVEKAAAAEARLGEAEANIDLTATVLKELVGRVDELHGDMPQHSASVTHPPADAQPTEKAATSDGLAALAAMM